MLKKFFVNLILLILSVNILSGCENIDTKRQTQMSSSDVAILTLFTFDGKSESVFGLMNLGHSFLSVENISDNTINIGKMEVEPKETIAVGTWSISAHFGVWYNVESNYILEHNKYDGRVSISRGISKNDCEKISQFILENDKWTPFTNCSKFAIKLWNTVATNEEKIKESMICSPSKLKKVIEQFENYEINKEILTDNKMIYFDKNTAIEYDLEKGL